MCHYNLRKRVKKDDVHGEFGQLVVQYVQLKKQGYNLKNFKNFVRRQGKSTEN